MDKLVRIKLVDWNFIKSQENDSVELFWKRGVDFYLQVYIQKIEGKPNSTCKVWIEDKEHLIMMGPNSFSKLPEKEAIIKIGTLQNYLNISPFFGFTPRQIEAEKYRKTIKGIQREYSTQIEVPPKTT